jgi:hypothetical protein
MTAHVSFTAWRFDRATRELIGSFRIHGEYAANGEEIYRVPADATLIEPPEAPDGYKLVFDPVRQDWYALADHRGEVWYDRHGREVTIERLGRPQEWGLNENPMGNLAMG